MSVCSEFIGGVLTQTSTSVDACSGYVVITASEYASYFDAFTLDSELIAISIIFGFSIVVTSYFMGYPVGIAKKMINKA